MCEFESEECKGLAMRIYFQSEVTNDLEERVKKLEEAEEKRRIRKILKEAPVKERRVE